MTAEVRGRLGRKARVIAPGPVVPNEGAWSFFGAVRFVVESPLLSSVASLITVRATDAVDLDVHVDPPSYPVRPIGRFSRPGHSLLSLVYDLLHQGDHFRRLNHDFFGQGLQIVSMN